MVRSTFREAIKFGRLGMVFFTHAASTSIQRDTPNQSELNTDHDRHVFGS